MQKFVLLLSLALAAGCASTGHFKAYEGEIPEHKQARVVANVEEDFHKNLWGGIYAQTRIACVDGLSTHTFSGYGGSGGYAPEVLLKPGFHYITVVFTAGQWAGGSTMWLDAEPGHTYETKYDQEGSSFRMWLEERSTGEKVGGVPGGEPAGNVVENKCG